MVPAPLTDTLKNPCHLLLATDFQEAWGMVLPPWPLTFFSGLRKPGEREESRNDSLASLKVTIQMLAF